MPYLSKSAAVRAKNLDDLTNILARTGKNYASGSAAETVKRMYTKGGSGSFIFDAAASLPRRVLRFGSKGGTKPTVGAQTTKMINDAVAKYRRAAANADMAAGNYLHDTLKKSPVKIVNRMGDIFTNTKNFKVIGAPGSPDSLTQVVIPSASAPLNKLKKGAVQVAGTIAVSKGIHDIAQMQKRKQQQKSEQKQGDKGGGVMKEAKMSREELIEKIAKTVKDNNIELSAPSSKEHLEQLTKFAQLATHASEALKMASSDNKILKDQCEKLGQENDKLRLQIMAQARSERATKLAHTMHQKRIIKKAEIDSKVDEIMDMSDDAFDILAETVNNMPIVKTASDDGVDSLQYIAESAEETTRQRTLADAIKEL